MVDASGDGRGIGMLTNYLGYSEHHYDTGMRDPLDTGGAARPLERAWAQLASSG